MVVSLDDQPRYMLMAWNAEVAELAIRPGASHVQNSSMFAELEGISIVDNVLFLEGYFGDMAIEVTTVLVERLT
ncbi:hypothetical protein [Pseudomonas sp. Ost2]|uniref:hypothetical protein n=1 Tax=Pseudomonas sp. Ost2 TaxID=2678260 RepID=UPI001FD5EA75|nr:hypothetical protein [Pseudomonas sp. Ost2]